MIDLVRRLEHRSAIRPPPRGSLPRRWPLRLGIVAVTAWLVYLFVFSGQGILRILSLKNDLSLLERRNTAETRRVKLVDAELQRVRTDPFYKEKFLREKTGMVRSDEIVYRVVPESTAQKAIEARAIVPAPRVKPGIAP